MIVPGPEVAYPSVPDGLTARLRVEVRDDDGAARQVKDRRQRFKADHGVVLSVPTRVDVDTIVRCVSRYPDELQRFVLADADSRSSSAAARVVADPVAFAVDLARAGVVELVCDVVDGDVQLFRRWLLTDTAKEARRRLSAAQEARHAQLEQDVEAIAAGLPPPAGRFLVGAVDQIEAAASRWSRSRVLGSLGRLAAALPTDGVSLSVFASEMTDDTHGLDRRSPMGELAAGIAAAVGGITADTSTASGWRDAWQSVGVAADGYACSVLVLGLPGRRRHPAGAVLKAGRRHRQPVIVTLRSLTTNGDASAVAPPARRSPGWIFTVENAALVETAAAEAVDVPVVHTGGVPNTAVRRILRDAARQGWRVAVGSDFEWRALEGAKLLLEDLGAAAVPWRLSVEDYEAATSHDLHRPLSTDATTTPWDHRLAERMLRSRRRVTEENRIDVLVGDLRAGSPPQTTR